MWNDLKKTTLDFGYIPCEFQFQYKACTCTGTPVLMKFFSNYKSKFPTTVEMQTSNRYMSDQFTSAPNLRTRTHTLVFLL